MAKLFGVQAGTIQEYILKDQRGDPVEERVVWLLKPLGVEEYADIQNSLYQVQNRGKKREERFLTGTQILQILAAGLVGWRNFFFADGTEVPWDDPNQEKTEEGRLMIMKRNLDKIPAAARQELADELRGEATLGEDE